MRWFFISILFVLLPEVALSQPTAKSQLVDYMLIDLQRLDLTYCLLDSYADSLWPGWKGYKDIGFRFTYPNKTELLVHYNVVPAGYSEALEGRFSGKRAWVKKSEETETKVVQPVVGGGRFLGGSPPIVLVEHTPVGLSYPWMEEWHTQRGYSTEESHRLLHTSDEQIMVYIHELFHAYQATLRLRVEPTGADTPDSDYAAYTEIEGIALENGMRDPDPARAIQYVQDFLSARQAKFGCLTNDARIAESLKEIKEGLCTYVEFGVLRFLQGRNNCVPGIIPDHHYYGFRDANYFLEKEVEILRRTRGSSLDLTTKPYVYGYFQALLLDRFLPDWKKDLFKKEKTLAQLLQSVSQIDSAKRTYQTERLNTIYNFPTLREQHGRYLAEASKTMRSIDERKGRTYIIDLSRVGHLEFVANSSSYRSDSQFKVYYPAGVHPIDISGVRFESREMPLVVENYYFVRWIDEKSGSAIDLKYDRKDEAGLYHDAVAKTGGFVLKAPRLRIAETERFIKLSVFPVTK